VGDTPRSLPPDVVEALARALAAAIVKAIRREAGEPRAAEQGTRAADVIEIVTR
jgi:hypothetical protein